MEDRSASRLRELYWLAGILEGEGTFLHGRVREKYLRMNVRVAMCDEDVVRRCWTVAGVGRVGGPYTYAHGSTRTWTQQPYDRHPSRWKPTWSWTVDRHADAAALMMTVLPLMGTRRAARIRECLGAWQANPYSHSAHRAKFTHCPQGHPYDEANTYLYRGHRSCRACHRIRAREARLRR